MKGTTGFPLRVRYTKQGKVRFASHRDLARAFERALRIEQLPLAFTKGFSPRPKISFGLALGVGHESTAEYLDVELDRPVELDALPAALSAALPPGVDVTGIVALSPRAPALQDAVTSVEVSLSFSGMTPRDLDAAVDAARAAAILTVTTQRKGHAVIEDLRPSLLRLATTAGAPAPATVEAELRTQPRGVRPADLITALRGLVETPLPGGGEDRVLRTHQWIERDGARLEPLEADHDARATLARMTSKGPTDDRRHDTTSGNGPPDRSDRQQHEQQTGPRTERRIA